MQVPAAYLAVVLIWSTTPLAIKWSGANNYLFGVTARMVIGVVLAIALVFILRLPMAWGKQARRTYLAAGLGIYGAMLSVYWAAQYIPSGWISVIFGMTPIVTGVMAAKMLENHRLGLTKLFAMLLGLFGLLSIFYTGEHLADHAEFGVIGVMVSVLIHSYSAIVVKKIAHQAHGLVITTGGLMVAVPLYLLTWFVTGASWPEGLSNQAVSSIVYLGCVGSVLGFALYYFILKKISAVRVAMLTLLTPVLALLLGSWLNDEAIGWSVIAGTLLIMSGLVLFEVADRQLFRVRIK